MIQLCNLTVDFEQRLTLRDVDWRIQPGQHWAICGPNGSGKSALAAVLAGEGTVLAGEVKGRPAHVGVVSFEAQARLVEAERRKDDADLLDVICAGTPVREILDESCADHALQARLVSTFNLERLLAQSFLTLSSGEARKVLLVRALTAGADLLVLDEPFAGLDADSCEILNTLLDRVAQSVPIVMVLNRFDEIPDFVTHVAYTAAGRLEHRVARGNTAAMSSLARLLHLETTVLRIPPTDRQPRRPALAMGEPLVQLTRARVAYGEQVVFEGLDWAIHAGEHWQVTGPNGSGKTCLLNLITGDHPQCYVNDIRLFGMQRGSGESIWDIKRHIGYVSSALQWDYRVRVGVRHAIISGFYDSIGIYQPYTDEQRRIADRWLDLMGLAPLAARPFGELSFGDQRLVLTARAMVKHPSLLILDEPCLGLDDLNRQLVLTLIERICADGDTTVLYVNHRTQDAIAGIERHLDMRVQWLGASGQGCS